MELKKIVISPDSFKGTLTAEEVCDIIGLAIQEELGQVEIVKIPLSDGGEGMLALFHGRKRDIKVTDPNFGKVNAKYIIMDHEKLAIIEMAEAAGLGLAKEPKNPSLTTTFGVGEMILDALNQGCRNFIIGIGGSATNDGGIGMAAALGAQFLDKERQEISLNGQGLGNLKYIAMDNIDSRIKECDIQVACDVDNPLYGKNGAAYIFSPQKGADEAMVALLDRHLRNYAQVIQEELKMNVQDIKGAGAAGGLGAGLVAFAGGTLKPGIDILLDSIDYQNKIKGADLIITGEGQIDGQSVRGKVPVGVVRRANEEKIPVIAIVGSIGEGSELMYHEGLKAIFSINRKAMDFQIAKKFSRENLFNTTKDIMKLAKIFF